VPGTSPFAQVLESAGKLSLEEQETLVDILNRRLIDLRRAQLARDVRDAQEEHRLGECQAVTADELMREITG
jgi:hypothetical protein